MPNWGVLGKAIKGLPRTAWGSPYGRSMLYGAGLGAAYGAVSDNTSMMGGALRGAALFGGVRLGASALHAGLSRGILSNKTGFGMLNQIGRGSASQIGSTLSRALNPIKSTMKAFWG